MQNLMFRAKRDLNYLTISFFNAKHEILHFAYVSSCSYCCSYCAVTVQLLCSYCAVTVQALLHRCPPGLEMKLRPNGVQKWPSAIKIEKLPSLAPELPEAPTAPSGAHSRLEMKIWPNRVQKWPSAIKMQRKNCRIRPQSSPRLTRLLPASPTA